MDMDINECRWQDYKFDTLERANYDQDVVNYVNDNNNKTRILEGILWADKHETSKWHDLIANPTDLPNVNEEVLVVTNNEFNKFSLCRLYLKKDKNGNVIDLTPQWCCINTFAESIIGWMRIPEFK